MTQPSTPGAFEVARWQTGQTWAVEYLRSVVSPAKRPAPSSPPPQRSVWRYQAGQVNPELGGIPILAAEEGGDRKFELWFDLPSPNLRRVVKIVANRRSDFIVHSGRDPFFGWSQEHPVIFDWPGLPLEAQDAERTFVSEDGLPVDEVIRVTAPSQLEISMMMKRQIDAGFTQTQRVKQVWEKGRPWWSSAVVDTGYDIDGSKSVERHIVGRLLA